MGPELQKETTRAEIQDSIYKINCDPGLKNLICKGAKAKHDLDLELEYVTPLLEVSPQNPKMQL